jgi:hypothetical protein
MSESIQNTCGKCCGIWKMKYILCNYASKKIRRQYQKGKKNGGVQNHVTYRVQSMAISIARFII